MQIMIHACPARMWYVEHYLVPELERQGAHNITIWNDSERKGNLIACMESFASCVGDGGTWHLQDDVLPCRNFVDRITQEEKWHRDKILCGFVNEQAGPDCNLRGEVYVPDMWYSFPCIYVPNQLARECASWFFDGHWRQEAQFIASTLESCGSGDDWFFREFMELHHGGETVINLTPCLVEHVDMYLGGSAVSPYRGFWARAVYWDDIALIDELRAWINAHERRS